MKKRSIPFRKARTAQKNAAAEDYTELVSELISDCGEARTCAIAEHMGVSHVTVCRTLQRLQEEGYLVTGPRLPVTLTSKGQRTAKMARHRHQLLVELLKQLGVSPATAESDAEGAEHHLSPETIRCIELFLRKGLADKNAA
ncbi:MAG: iron dependent repressor, metal binding and dimerization domain protein [bacterium]|nr:iron dependent repressor, metal binding and dimerization domain protein [bacterium]